MCNKPASPFLIHLLGVSLILLWSEIFSPLQNKIWSFYGFYQNEPEPFMVGMMLSRKCTNRWCGEIMNPSWLLFFTLLPSLMTPCQDQYCVGSIIFTYYIFSVFILYGLDGHFQNILSCVTNINMIVTIHIYTYNTSRVMVNSRNSKKGKTIIFIHWP